MSNDALRHEALHTAHLISDMFDRHLLAHPAVQADREALARAEQIATDLADFYQALGRR